MAKKLSIDDVAKVAKLARLKLSRTDLTKFQTQLSTVVSYISELSLVDTKNIEPASQTAGLVNIVRGDELKDVCLSSEEALSGTSKVHNGYFVVPSVFGGENNE